MTLSRRSVLILAYVGQRLTRQCRNRAGFRHKRHCHPRHRPGGVFYRVQGRRWLGRLHIRRINTGRRLVDAFQPLKRVHRGPLLRIGQPGGNCQPVQMHVICGHGMGPCTIIAQQPQISGRRNGGFSTAQAGAVDPARRESNPPQPRPGRGRVDSHTEEPAHGCDRGRR